MALSKEDKKRFLPDLLQDNVVIEVIKISFDGSVQKKDMTFGEWKLLNRQKGFVYRAYQKNFSQFNLK